MLCIILFIMYSHCRNYPRIVYRRLCDRRFQLNNKNIAADARIDIHKEETLVDYYVQQ